MFAQLCSKSECIGNLAEILAFSANGIATRQRQFLCKLLHLKLQKIPNAENPVLLLACLAAVFDELARGAPLEVMRMPKTVPATRFFVGTDEDLKQGLTLGHDNVPRLVCLTHRIYLRLKKKRNRK